MRFNKVMLKFIKMGITIIMAMLVVYVTVSISFSGFQFEYRIFTEPAMEAEPGRDIEVTIEASMGGGEIGKLLESKGLVRDATLFQIQLFVSAYSDEILPGTYTLNTSMTPKEMMIEMSKEEK